MNIKLQLELIYLAAVWGASFMFLRVSSPEFGPFPLVFVRTFVAGLVLLPLIILSKQHGHLLRRWKLFLCIGAVSTALPFCLFSYTSLHLSAGNTSILNATTPFFSSIVAFFWIGERLTKWGVVGLILGFVGVYVLSSGGEGETLLILPILAALGATFCYAYGSTYAKLKMSDFTPLVVAAGSQIYTALIMLPFAAISWPAETPSTNAWISLLCLAVFSTALALLSFFRLIQTVGVNKTVSVTYLIPVFGFAWGYLFLGEQITLKMCLGAAIILAGVGFSTGILDKK